MSNASVLLLAALLSACQQPPSPPPVEPPSDSTSAQPPSSAGEERFVLSDPPGVMTVRGEPVTTPPFVLPPGARARLFAGSQRLPPEEATLRLEGVTLPRDGGVDLHVFLNVPDADARTPATDPSYAGSLTLMRAASNDPGAPLQIRLGLAHKIHDVLQSRSDLTVTIVPVDGEGRPSQIAFGLDRIVLLLR